MTIIVFAHDEDRIYRASPLVQITNSIAQLTKGVILTKGLAPFLLHF